MVAEPRASNVFGQIKSFEAGCLRLIKLSRIQLIMYVYYLVASTRVNNPAAPESFCCLGKKRDSNIWNSSIELFVGTFHQSSFLFQFNLSFLPVYVTLGSFEYKDKDT